MKLFELHNQEPVFAWFEPHDDGVVLCNLIPMEQKMDELINNALELKKKDRAKELKSKKEKMKQSGQKYLTNRVDWWENEQSFNSSENGRKGLNKGFLFNKYPTLQILSSKDEAIKAAKNAELI